MSGEPELEAIQRAICCPKRGRRCVKGADGCAAAMVEHFASAVAVRALYREAAEAALVERAPPALDARPTRALP